MSVRSLKHQKREDWMRSGNDADPYTQWRTGEKKDLQMESLSHGQVALSDLRRMFQKESSEMQVTQRLDRVQTVKDSEYSKPPTY